MRMRCLLFYNQCVLNFSLIRFGNNHSLHCGLLTNDLAKIEFSYHNNRGTLYYDFHYYYHATEHQTSKMFIVLYQSNSCSVTDLSNWRCSLIFEFQSAILPSIRQLFSCSMFFLKPSFIVFIFVVLLQQILKRTNQPRSYWIVQAVLQDHNCVQAFRETEN